MIHVVAGAVTASDGRVLIAERPAGKQLAGHWEFPGGKLEPGETRAEGLARELNEELGITLRDPRPLMRVRHRYDFGEVLIDMWVVARYSGEPRGLDGQRLRWCSLDELNDAELLLADRPVVRALRLPERLVQPMSDDYVVCESLEAGDVRLRGAWCASADAALTAATDAAKPADFLVMRRTLATEALTTLCAAVSVPVFAVGLPLTEAWHAGASGVSELSFI